MANYVIGGLVQHFCTYQVEADNEHDAVKKLNELYPGECQDLHIQFVELADDDEVVSNDNYKTFNESPYGDD